MEILGITIMGSSCRSDLVCLRTDLPSALPDTVKSNLTISFEVEKGKGEEYLKKHFDTKLTLLAKGVWDNIRYINTG